MSIEAPASSSQMLFCVILRLSSCCPREQPSSSSSSGSMWKSIPRVHPSSSSSSSSSGWTWKNILLIDWHLNLCMSRARDWEAIQWSEILPLWWCARHVVDAPAIPLSFGVSKTSLPHCQNLRVMGGLEISKEFLWMDWKSQYSISRMLPVVSCVFEHHNGQQLCINWRRPFASEIMCFFRLCNILH